MCLGKPMPLVLRSRRLRLLFPSVVPRLLFPSVVHLFSSASAPPPQSPASQFVVDNLVSSCGLSGVEAVKAYIPLAHLKSPEKSEAVVRLLKREGLSVAQIRRVFLQCPRVLNADADKTLEPKIGALRGAGFSGSELAQLISSCPTVLYLRAPLPRVEFWRDLLGNNQNLLKAASKIRGILSYSIKEKVVPQLSLLHSMGVPRDKIGTVILGNPELISYNIDRIKVAGQEVNSMGFPPGSGLFTVALRILLVTSRAKMDARVKLFRRFGWSQADLICAFRGFPSIFGLSEKKTCTMMDFLLKEAGCDSLYIARHPVLLGLSLEKRLMPRYYVLHFLGTKGLRRGNDGLWTAMIFSEKKFVERYIAPNSEKFPEILGIYHAVGANKTSS